LKLCAGRKDGYHLCTRKLAFATGFFLCTFAALAVVLVTEKGRMFRPHHHPI